jgi:hypothetical protein
LYNEEVLEEESVASCYSVIFLEGLRNIKNALFRITDVPAENALKYLSRTYLRVNGSLLFSVL